ncbi:MAG: hypothetical protein GX995_00705 [Clostridiales bacterium]|nr:hypothetical protein [Clostridiales bacterium]
MVVRKQLQNQEELINYFDYPVSLLQTKQALQDVMWELAYRKRADNVRYIEVRMAPNLHTKKRLTLHQVLETMHEVISDIQNYVDIIIRFIVVGLRTIPLEENLVLLEEINKFNKKDFIVAVDFAGYESKAPDPTDQFDFFCRAEELGFEITVHCGELPNSSGMLEKIVDLIKPKRIAHGAMAIANENLCEKLIKQNIQLDLCPTSNIDINLYSDIKNYPAVELYKKGVPISISTDSPVLHNVSLSEEFINLYRECDISINDLWDINMNSLRKSFLDNNRKMTMIKEFQDWFSGF